MDTVNIKKLFIYIFSAKLIKSFQADGLKNLVLV